MIGFIILWLMFTWSYVMVCDPNNFYAPTLMIKITNVGPGFTKDVSRKLSCGGYS